MCNNSNKTKLDGLRRSSSNFVFITLFFLLLVHIPARAQVKMDTTHVDSVRVPRHSAKTASLLSLALPGLGQVYNRKYWKVPIIYAGLATTIYYAITFNSEFQKYKTAYIASANGDSMEIRQNELVQIYRNDTRALNENMDYYRRYRDLNILITAGIYALNIVDAAVDAHLFYFDVSDNLSLRIQPATIPLGPYSRGAMPATGLSLTLYFNKKERRNL